jgi:hypothetical protein
VEQHDFTHLYNSVKRSSPEKRQEVDSGYEDSDRLWVGTQAIPRSFDPQEASTGPNIALPGARAEGTFYNPLRVVGADTSLD